MRTIAIIFLLFVFLLLFIFGPNIVWFFRSTATVVNNGKNEITSVVIYVDNKEVKVGDLRPGEQKLVYLPKSGDSNYSVSFFAGTELVKVCSEYVEGEMYHVETSLKSKDGSSCSVSLPSFSELFSLKFLRGL